jgi:predicted MPP superfamily phosphohydrolase
MLGRNVFPLVIQKILYFPGTFWLGMSLYLFAFFTLTDFIYRIVCFFYSGLKKFTGRYRKIQVFSGYFLIICLSIFGYYQFKHPQIVEQKIEIAKNAGGYKRLKVVGVSDLHLGVAIDKKQLEQYIRLINDQHPDLVIIAGDLIDNNVLPLEKEKMWESFGNLQAPLGAYYCLGNHDYLIGIESSMEFLHKTGLHLLIDSSVVINQSIQIIGRDDKQGNHSRKSLNELVKDADPALPLILLDHEPFHLNEAAENGIDLQFSGHTHQGQIFPANLIVEQLYELSHGYKRTGNTQYYVTSGLGLWGPPFRIGTHSEIVVFDIELK